jgi:steroid delta-isomerase-like uncharacterized protein
MHARPPPFSAPKHHVHLLHLATRGVLCNVKVKPNKAEHKADGAATVVICGLDGEWVHHVLQDEAGPTHRIGVDVVVAARAASISIVVRRSSRPALLQYARTYISSKGNHSVSNDAVIARFIKEVINQGNLNVADEIVAEDFVELDPLPGQRQGREGLKEVIAMLRAAFPDIHWVTEETVSAAEKVVTRFTWTGTHRGTFLGVPPTSKSVRVKGVVIDRLVSGKMTDSRILMDTLGLMQQLGVIPAAPTS